MNIRIRVCEYEHKQILEGIQKHKKSVVYVQTQKDCLSMKATIENAITTIPVYIFHAALNDKEQQLQKF